MAEKKEKYAAYVSTYTSGSQDVCGIKIYDVDMEKGRFTEKGQIEITNSSYMTTANNHHYLYSITDNGVQANEIMPDGTLRFINAATINGMRGCYLSTDYEDKFLFVAGYHDGKLTVLRVNKNGSVGEITDEIYHKGLGSVAERNFRPHINCARMTRDNKYLCEADLGMDRVNIYELNHTTGKLKLVDVVRSEQESAPRHLKFSRDGKYLYVVHELKNYVEVYHYYEKTPGDPEFEKIQTISTLGGNHDINTAACTLKLSLDDHYLISSNAGDDSVVLYSVDTETGLLARVFCLPVNGSYPKDASLFPDNRHLVSLNHEENTLTFFSVDVEKGTMVLNGPQMKVQRPNCVIFHKLA
jgi:6-phosphogluconolactonase